MLLARRLRSALLSPERVAEEKESPSSEEISDLKKQRTSGGGGGGGGGEEERMEEVEETEEERQSREIKMMLEKTRLRYQAKLREKHHQESEREKQRQREREWDELNRGLWDACTEGDLQKVKGLLSLRFPPNLNYRDPEYLRSSFYRACSHGRSDLVLLLLLTPGVDVTCPSKEGASPLFIACQQGFADVVKLLLLDGRSDPGLSRPDFSNPLTIASEGNRIDVVRVLMECDRIDPNRQRGDGVTAIWYAAQEGFYEVVETLLANEHLIDVDSRWVKSENSAAMQARAKGHLAVEALLLEYKANPQAVRTRIQNRLGFRDSKAAALFALIIFHCDEYIRLKDSASPEIRRFFAITSLLPQELQMSLSLLAFSSLKTSISSKLSEPAFRELALYHILQEAQAKRTSH